MKKFSTRLLAAMTILCLYTQAFAQNIGAEINNRLRHLSPSAQTGLLADKSIGKLDPRTFSTNTLNEDNAVDKARFSGLYFSMQTMPVARDYTLPDPMDIYAERATWQYPSGEMPLSLMAFRYDYIRPDAITSGLITIGNDNVLVPNVPVNDLLIQDTVFAVGPHHDVVHSDRVTLYFPTIAKNLNAAIDTLWIDYNAGWQMITRNQPLTINFSANGLQEIKTKIFIGNKILVGHFVLDVQFGFAQGNPPNPTGSYDRYNPRIESVVAEDAYLGERATANLYIFTYCDDNIIRKPYIIVDGFEHNANPSINSNTFKNIFELNKLGISTTIPSNSTEIEAHQTLYNAGYDLIFVDYTDRGSTFFDENGVEVFKASQRGGQDYIQRNGLMLETAIKFVNDEMRANDGLQKINLIGMSMGGVVCKWAILDMEERGIAHNIENFWSFDSPHRGANIPAGLQAMVHDMYNLDIDMGYGFKIELKKAKPEIVEAYSVLTSNFANASLIYKVAENNDRTAYNALQNEFNTKGKNHDGEIIDCAYKAISNGALDKTNQLFDAGDLLLSIDTRQGAISLGGGTWRDFWSELQKALHTTLEIVCTVSAQKNNGPSYVYTRDLYKTILHMGIPPQLSAYSVADSHPLDNCPGGFTVLGDNINGITWVQEAYSFTPTASALDIRGDVLNYLFYDFSDAQNTVDQNIVRPKSYVGPDKFTISFTSKDGVIKYFTPQMNQLHVFTTYRAIAFMASDLIKSQDFGDLNTLNNQDFNFGNNEVALLPNLNENEFKPNTFSNNITIPLSVINGGGLFVNKEGQVGMVEPSNMTINKTPSHYDLFIGMEGCSGEAGSVTIDNKSTFRIGDATVFNTANVYINKGAFIEVSGNLQIQPKSKLVIGKEGKLIIRSGAHLAMYESQIIVEEGGELIIEDEPNFTFWAGSKIIIHGKAHFGKITCANVNGEIHLMHTGNLQLHGDFNYRGVNKNQLLFNIAANNSVICDHISFTLKNGKVIGGNMTQDFNFENGAVRIQLEDLTFTGGSGVHVSKVIPIFNTLKCTFSNMEMAIKVSLLPNSLSQITIAQSEFLNCNGLYAYNVGKIDVVESEFIGESSIYRQMWHTQQKGIEVHHSSMLNVDRSFFAKMQYGILTKGTNTFMKCSYSLNNIYGIEHFNYFNAPKTLKLVKSGLINNLVGCQTNNTNLDINISKGNTSDANLFVHCEGDDIYVPLRFAKTQEDNSIGGDEHERDVPNIPVCGAFFKGTVTQFNIVGLALQAKYNMWMCGTANGNCYWSDLKDMNSTYIVLDRKPEAIYDNRNIEECDDIIYIVNNDNNPQKEINNSLPYAVYPNPANEVIYLNGNSDNIYKFSIMSIYGETLMSGSGYGESTVQTTSLTPGIYFVKFLDHDRKEQIIKFIKVD